MADERLSAFTGRFGKFIAPRNLKAKQSRLLRNAFKASPSLPQQTPLDRQRPRHMTTKTVRHDCDGSPSIPGKGPCEANCKRCRNG